MLDFDQYVEKHGEYGAQALIEQIERTNGIRANAEAPLPLEVRWNTIMMTPLPQQQRLAA